MGLRDQSLRGGAYLVVREVVGMSVRLGGVLLLTRAIGPQAYGLYATAFAVTTALSTLAWFGVDTYLIRQEGEVRREVYDQAFWLLAAISGGVAVVAVGVAALAAPWLADDGYLGPLLVMSALIPIKVLWTPAQAQLERGLRYRRMAAVEVSADVVNYAVALTLAWMGAGVWAAVAGFGMWQLWLLLGSFGLARYVPRWHWEGDMVRDMVVFGRSYSPSVWLERCRDLVPTMVLARFLGPEAVGYAALTLRITEALTFGRKIVRRVSLVAVAKVQSDPDRIAKGLQEGMVLQALAVGPFLVVFALLAPWLVPLGFGEDWRPVADLYPLVAVAFLVSGVFTMHRTTLYVLRRNVVVTGFWAVHLALLAGAGTVLIPRYGLVGYGMAELVAVAAYGLLVAALRDTIHLRYGEVALWVLALGAAASSPGVAFPGSVALWLPLVALLAAPSTRRKGRAYVALLRRSRSRPAPAEVPA